MRLKRSFEHVLDEGGMRRATLQGKENLAKRHKIAAACFNLSLLLRTLLGVGISKQSIAGAYGFLEALLAYIYGQAWRFRILCVAAEDFVSHFHKLLGFQPLHETTGFVESRSGAVKFRRSLSGDQPFRLLVPE
jgi:hypothetical protein